MKKLLLIVFIFFASTALGQTPSRGCLFGTQLATEKNVITPVYYSSNHGVVPTTAPSCPRARLIANVGTCRFGLIGFNYEEWTYEILTPPIQCDMDHYAYGAVLVAGIFVFSRMRK